jgi:hypothetical protein
MQERMNHRRFSTYKSHPDAALMELWIPVLLQSHNSRHCAGHSYRFIVLTFCPVHQIVHLLWTPLVSDTSPMHCSWSCQPWSMGSDQLHTSHSSTLPPVLGLLVMLPQGTCRDPRCVTRGPLIKQSVAWPAFWGVLSFPHSLIGTPSCTLGLCPVME